MNEMEEMRLRKLFCGMINEVTYKNPMGEIVFISGDGGFHDLVTGLVDFVHATKKRSSDKENTDGMQ